VVDTNILRTRKHIVNSTASITTGYIRYSVKGAGPDTDVTKLIVAYRNCVMLRKKIVYFVPESVRTTYQSIWHMILYNFNTHQVFPLNTGLKIAVVWLKTVELDCLVETC